MISIKLFIGAAFTSITVVVGLFDVSFAQETQLEQRINPIECVYTTTQTGTGSNVDSNCDNQPIPLVTSTVTNNGRPVLKGVFSAARAIMLRVWIDGQWYTYGTDARLTANGDSWELDLSNLKTPLSAGVYTVVVEVEMDDGLLLRNAEAATFEILNVQAPAAQQPSLLTSQLNAAAPFFTRVILPQIQEALRDVATPSSLPVVGDKRLDAHNDIKNTPTVTNKFQVSMMVIAILIFIIAVLFYLFRHRL